jgi:hypothetical protein
LLGKLFERLGAEKHFIRIANHAGPAEIAHAIHYLRGTGSAVSQIAAVEYQVGSSLPQIREDCFKGGPIAVNIGYDCDAHKGSRVATGTTIIPRGSCAIINSP